MKTIFISHAYNDPNASDKWLLKLKHGLEELNFRVLIDIEEAQKGNLDFAKKMEEWVYKSDFVLPILTPLYIKKIAIPEGDTLSGVESEVDDIRKVLEKRNGRDKIIPIKRNINTKKIIAPFNKTNWIDFSEKLDYSEKFQQLQGRLSANIIRNTDIKINENIYQINVDLVNHLSDLGFDPVNIYKTNCEDINCQILYPVVPRIRVNLIHKAQLELLNFLSQNFGWSIKLVIVDYDTSEFSTQTHLDKFKNELASYFYKISNSNTKLEIEYYSDYNKNENREEILQQFFIISSKITLDNLINITVKDYSEKIAEKKREKKLADTLKPIFTMALGTLVSEDAKSKTIILAGLDETLQWKSLIRIKRNIGSWLIPILELKNEDDAYHEDKKIDTDLINKTELLKMLESGNTFSWLFTHFIALNIDIVPRDIFLDYSNLDIYQIYDDLVKTNKTDNINKKDFVNFVYKRISD